MGRAPAARALDEGEGVRQEGQERQPQGRRQEGGARVEAAGQRARRRRGAQGGGQAARAVEMGVAEAGLGGEALQIGFADRGEVLAAMGRLGAEGGVARVVALARFRVGRGRPGAVLLLDVALAQEARRPAAIVEARDRRQAVAARADDQPAHRAGLAVEGRAAGGRQGRRLLAVGEEQEVGVDLPRHGDRPEQAGRDAAVPLPGHARIEGRDGAVQRREIGADLDRREQQERPPVGEQAERHPRAAGEVGQHRPQRRLDGLEPAHGSRGGGIVAHRHAAGDVDHRQHRHAGAGERDRRGDEGCQRQHQGGRQDAEPPVAQVAGDEGGQDGGPNGGQDAPRSHGPPRGWPGMSVQIFFGSARSSSPVLRSNSG